MGGSFMKKPSEMHELSDRIERLYDFIDDGLYDLSSDARNEDDPTELFKRFRKGVREQFKELVDRLE